jgi:hypothetical protein
MFFSPYPNDLDGVFFYLYNKLSSSDYFRTVIASESSHYLTIFGLVTLLIDPTNEGTEVNSNWCSDNLANSYFTISFLHYQLKLTNYTFQSRTDPPVSTTHNFPKEWKVEGTNDLISYKIIHQKPSNSDITSQAAKKTYEISNSEYFKTFKITQTGASTISNYYFLLHRVEFFGNLIQICPCATYPKKFFLILFEPFFKLIYNLLFN